MNSNAAKGLIFCAVIGLGFLSSCGQKNEVATVKHLTMEMPECDVNEDVARKVWTRIDGRFSGNRDLAYYYVQQISMLPKPLLNFLVGRIETSQMSLYFTGTSRMDWIGETFGGMDGTYPSRQGFNPNSYAVRNSALHEVGHALSYYSYQFQGRNDEIQDTQNGFQNALNSESRNIWSYAKSTRYEWFASAFSHYMCSKAAREETLPVLFPSSYQFMTTLYRGVMAAPDVSKAKIIRQTNDEGKTRLFVYLNADVKSLQLQSGSEWLPVELVFDPQPEFYFIRGVDLPESLRSTKSAAIRYENSNGEIKTMNLDIEDK